MRLLLCRSGLSSPVACQSPGRSSTILHLDIRPRVVPCRVLHITRASKIVDSTRHEESAPGVYTWRLPSFGSQP